MSRTQWLRTYVERQAPSKQATTKRNVVARISCLRSSHWLSCRTYPCLVRPVARMPRSRQASCESTSVCTVRNVRIRLQLLARTETTRYPFALITTVV